MRRKGKMPSWRERAECHQRVVFPEDTGVSREKKHSTVVWFTEFTQSLTLGIR